MLPWTRFGTYVNPNWNPMSGVLLKFHNCPVHVDRQHTLPYLPVVAELVLVQSYGLKSPQSDKGENSRVADSRQC